ncbi:MAG TPA: dUTP diphosphatase [Phycisphaerales bacterium]|nr:dUTP diphosphatase [Phycisphaerales bacterium]HIB01529.1 dUTP diphosphatase [Phycisphaerales bacterium]HIB49806.1 dUTP diphosphatase [Phycisphaerales bacterium]HIN84747.1 dUTP diphosphatase [Phycisphaerales bacterium]HIO19987.1 dUTP diphosphatase [Phycisphaerales bacterium]
MHHVKVKYKKLRETAVVPCYQSKLAAGMDLHSANTENIPIAPGAIEMIPLGFAMALPDHFEAQVRPRSGLASKFGVTLPNAPGTIDADYRGECCVPLINHGKEMFIVEPNMRIAQMIIAPVVQATFEVVEELDDTVRGAGGFGSTGS